MSQALKQREYDIRQEKERHPHGEKRDYYTDLAISAAYDFELVQCITLTLGLLFKKQKDNRL